MQRVTDLGSKELPITPREHLGPKIAAVGTEKFGEIYAPERLSDLVSLLEHYADRGRKVATWRGQSDVDWGIDCTAFRRLSKGLPDENLKPGTLEGTVREYERRLLEDARMVGHGDRDGRRLNDLELLGVLRHYGAATRMMDFTRNAFLALWFATQSNPKCYGLLMGIHPKPGNARRLRSEDQLNMKLEDLLDQDDMKDSYIFWEPRHLFERMRVQQSLFLFGEVVRRPWGAAPLGALGGTTRLADELVLIAVSPRLKRQMNDETGYRAGWETLFGYSERYVYPDLEGYAGSHSAGSPIYSGFFDTPTFEGTPAGPPMHLDE